MGATRVETADAKPSKHNLPAQLMTLLGRETEIVEVKQLLGSHRLVTLTGAGGIGKTRLALRVAAEVADSGQCPDGVWLVELAGLVDSKLLPQTFARALRAQGAPGASFEEIVVQSLQKRTVLIVLDNCEHLINSCAHLVDHLLKALGDLRVLATSREPLGIPGEIAWSVPSLGVPRAGATRLEELAECASVQLLVERAGAVVKTFGLTSRNAAAVATVCQRLEGIPLALELAAARLAVLTPEQVADRLGDVSRLLAAGSRTADPRQQTLWATIDWSFQLLSERERALFRRCSVFIGGWTLDAAEYVCADVEFDAAAVLDTLGQLVAKSLVVAEEYGAVERYRMLEPIRQFAAEQLAATGKEAEADVRNRHLGWLVDLSERAEVGLWGREQIRWLERLEAEHDNIRVALEWSRGTGQTEALLRLASAASRFWDLHGYLIEGFSWLTAAVEATPGLRTRPRAQGLTRAAYLAVQLNDPSTAESFLLEALALAEQLEDEESIGAVFLVKGMVARTRGEYVEAAKMFERSLVMSRRAEHRPGIYTSLYLLASAVRFLGDSERAIALHQESLELKREHGDHWGVGNSLFSLGTLARLDGDVERARSLYRESLGLRRQLGDRLGICVCLEALAGLATSAEEAIVLLAGATRLRETVGPGGHGSVRTDQALAELRSKLPPDRFAEHWARGRELGLEQILDSALGPDHRADASGQDGVGVPRELEPRTPAVAEEFRKLVEDALRRINDAPALRQHALIRCLPSLIPPDAPGAEAGALLRGELLQAIERLRPNGPRPSPGTRTGVGAWLHYFVLYEAYVEGRSNQQIMLRYDIAERTFFRARRHASEAVAEDLAQRNATARVSHDG